MKKVMFLILASLLLFGCSSTSKRGSTLDSSPATQLQTQLSLQDSSIERAKESTTRVRENATVIKDIAKKPEKLTPEEKSDIQAKSTEIERDSKLIEEELNLIQQSNDTIDKNVVPSIVQTEQDLNQSQEDLKNAENTQKQKERLFTIMVGIFGIGSLAIIAGIVLSFLNPRLGMMVAGAGLLVTLIAAAGTYFMKQLAIVGLILVGILLVGTLVVIIRSLLQSKTKDKALESNVEIIEQLKNDPDLPQEIHDRYFGNDEKEVEGVFKEKLTAKEREMIHKIRRKKIHPVEDESSEYESIMTANLLKG